MRNMADPFGTSRCQCLLKRRELRNERTLTSMEAVGEALLAVGPSLQYLQYETVLDGSRYLH